MGRRHSPKRGSLAYLPRKRANSPVGKVHHWPNPKLSSPKLLGFSGYKVGMNYVYLLGDVRGSPSYGQEIIRPITILETPPMLACGIRAYSNTVDGLKASTEVWTKKLPKDVERAFSGTQNLPTSQKKIDKALSKVIEFRTILFTQPRLASVPQKKPELFEVKVGGDSIKDQWDYLIGILGKEVQISNVFKEGQFVDVIAITKGKGIQGPVKRWGIKKRHHKSRKTVRGVASLGPWSPHYVMYSVPRAGQTGYHQITERNKKILKINVGKDINPKSGFHRYGRVTSSSVLLDGSVPGPTKRLIKLRLAVHPPSHTTTEPPKITYAGLQVAQTE